MTNLSTSSEAPSTRERRLSSGVEGRSLFITLGEKPEQIRTDAEALTQLRGILRGQPEWSETNGSSGGVDG